MRRFILFLALAASIGCASTGASPGHRVGAVNSYTNPPCETLTLGVSTVHSAARLMLSTDTVGVNIVNLTGTASGTYTFEGSNDNTNWFTITLSSTLPALSSGSPTMIPASYTGFAWAYFRITYVGTSGSGTSQVCETLKG